MNWQREFTRPLMTRCTGHSAALVAILADRAEQHPELARHLLAGLDDREFVELRHQGALALIYAHLISLPRLERIKNLAFKKEQMAQRQMPQDPGGGFNLVDDGGLNF